MSATLRDEYLSIIAAALKNAPRTLQKKIGPSELGDPCSRRIAYKLLATPEREQKVNWKAAVGTGTHLLLEDIFDQVNLKHAETHEGVERFLIETRVTVGQVNDEDVSGSCDLFDTQTGTVTDWKTCGPSMLLKYARHGASDQYRRQAHLYGRGWQLLGHRVQRVMIVFFPRNGDLSDAVVWSEPYDEHVAVDALARATGISLATQVLGVKALDALATADAFCHLCPFFLPRSTDLSKGCPGDADATVNNHPDPANPFGVVTERKAS